MDWQFRKATELQFNKDKEYNYKHLLGLSGGLDSRMVSWVAHDMGYKEQLNVTVSQSNYLDETIPKQIASDLKHEWFFKFLDNGLFLKNIDEITNITGGNVLYFGLAHLNSFYKYFNFENFGLIHSGQLGDVVFGTFYKEKKNNNNYKFGDGAYSNRFINLISDFNFKIDYENQEIFNFYNRGFAGANNGLLMPQEYTETYSPFYNLEVLEFALSIPVEYRFDHQIYKKWILKKYPDAAKYKWEKINNYINSIGIKYKNKTIFYNQIFPKILKKLGLQNQNINTAKHMNPVEFWFNTNVELENFIENYYKKTINLISDNELKTDIENLFLNGKGIEKIQVLSLLSAVNFFFNDL